MKDKLSLEEIKSIVQFLEEHDVYEFSLERGSEKLHLKRGSGAEVTIAAPQQITKSGPIGLAPAAPKPAAATPQPKAEKKFHEVKSPMVGTFYKKPAPDKPPFVEVGQKIKKGDVICIIEAMKVMNEIESDKAGVVVEVCLEDGSVAEYDEALIKIDPNG